MRPLPAAGCQFGKPASLSRQEGPWTCCSKRKYIRWNACPMQYTLLSLQPIDMRICFCVCAFTTMYVLYLAFARSARMSACVSIYMATRKKHVSMCWTQAHTQNFPCRRRWADATMMTSPDIGASMVDTRCATLPQCPTYLNAPRARPVCVRWLVWQCRHKAAFALMVAGGAVVEGDASGYEDGYETNLTTYERAGRPGLLWQTQGGVK